MPFFKNDGERSDPGESCPIKRLPIINEIFESFINDSLTNHLDITGLFSDIKYGLRVFFSFFLYTFFLRYETSQRG